MKSFADRSKGRRRTWTALAAACLAALAQRPAVAASRALIVGINEYTGGVKPLKGCVADARDMEGLARSRGYEVHVLLDEQARRAHILGQLSTLLTSSEGGDDFLFYYSGHGTFWRDENSPKRDQEKYFSFMIKGVTYQGYFDNALMPVDFPDRPAERAWGNLIVDDELSDLFLPAARRGVHVRVIADSCFSGSIGREIDPLAPSTIVLDSKGGSAFREGARVWVDVASLGEPASKRGASGSRATIHRSAPPSPAPGDGSFVAVAGCSDTQLSWEWPTPGGARGAMTATLTELLERDPGASLTRVRDYLHQVVPGRAREPQTPQVETILGGDAQQLFRAPPQEPAGTEPAPAPPTEPARPQPEQQPQPVALVSVQVHSVIDGQPVARGTIRAGGQSFAISDGLARVPATALRDTLHVEAPGFFAKEHVPPKDLGGTVRIVLMPNLAARP